MHTKNDQEKTIKRLTACETAYSEALQRGAEASELRKLKLQVKYAMKDELESCGDIAPASVGTLAGIVAITESTHGASPTDIAKLRQHTSLVVRGSNPEGDRVALPTCDPRWLPAPEVVVRGSLFGLGTHRVVTATVNGKPVRTKERISFRKSEKPCGLAGDVQLFYRGPALDQGDLEVWLRLLELAREDLNEPVSFTLNSLLKDLGRNNGGKDFRLLMESLERLAEGSFSVSQRAVRGILDMSLVRTVLMDAETGKARATLDAKAAHLFGTSKGLSWTKLHREQRKSLAGKEIALWLHGFLSSHAKPIPLKLVDLRNACGTNATVFEFKRMLEGPPETRATLGGRGALDQLVRVGFLVSWKMVDGLVSVLRDTSGQAPSQLKFVAPA